MNQTLLDDLKAVLTGWEKTLGVGLHFTFDVDEGLHFPDLGAGVYPAKVERKTIARTIEVDGWQAWAVTGQHGGYWEPPEDIITEIGPRVLGLASGVAVIVSWYITSQIENDVGAMQNHRDFNNSPAPF